MRRTRRVLHVTESLGAGVASAISAFTEATPEIEHHLLASERGGSTVGLFDGRIASWAELPRGKSAMATIRAHEQKLQPDVIHAHSSWAGLLVRAGSRSPKRVVYSPHCFAFERRDIAPLARLSILVTELALARRGRTVVACSVREAQLARRLGARDVMFVPNVSLLARADDADNTSTDDLSAPRITIVATGRLSEQKDPAVFGEVVRLLRVSWPDLRAVWIGDGDLSMREDLRSVGVEVTGWLEPREVRATLKGASVMVHTARWEGFPIAILDAVCLGVPCVVREAPYAEGLDRNVRGADAPDLALRVSEILTSTAARDSNIESWAPIRDAHSESRQRKELAVLYGLEERP